MALKIFKSDNTANDEYEFVKKVKGEPFIAAPLSAFYIRKDQKRSICISYKLEQNGDLSNYLTSGPLPTPIMKLYVH